MAWMWPPSVSIRMPLAHGPRDLEAFATLAYPDAMKEALWNVMILDAEQLARLDHEWGVWVGREVQSWLSAQRLSSPDVVGSHGHTVFHKPKEGWTMQIEVARRFTPH